MPSRPALGRFAVSALGLIAGIINLLQALSERQLAVVSYTNGLNAPLYTNVSASNRIGVLVAVITLMAALVALWAPKLALAGFIAAAFASFVNFYPYHWSLLWGFVNVVLAFIALGVVMAEEMRPPTSRSPY